MKFYFFYYGSCLLVAGLVLGLVLGLVVGLAVAGTTADYPLSNTTITVLTIAFVVGIFLDWGDKFGKKESE